MSAMKKVLIISAHFPPSNLVSVHRARLLANHLADVNWKPIVLSVSPQYYEEKLDFDLEKLVEPEVETVRVCAISQKIARPLGFGDIGLRGFLGLFFAAFRLIKSQKIDLIFITIPSNYQSLLGRLLFELCHIPYVIDYQDPWVNESDLGERFLSKAGITQFLARQLEPIAVAGAAGLSGMTSQYFQSVIRRHPELQDRPNCAFQMGFSKKDHQKVHELKVQPRRLSARSDVKQIVYAGALLPKAVEPMLCFLKALEHVNRNQLGAIPIRFVCIGTGYESNNPQSHRILPLACKAGAEEWVDEYPERHPYLEVLASLNLADGVAVIGSTEAHYSPSKIFQAVLARKPLIALLHEKSEALSMLQKAHAKC
jgi:hypothetical protein